MGLGMGLFLGSMDTSHSFHPELQNMSTRESLIHSFRLTKSRAVSMGKNFALVGFVYSGIECLISKVSFILNNKNRNCSYSLQIYICKIFQLLHIQKRGKHDNINPVLAGCVTGGLLAASGKERAVNLC